MSRASAMYSGTYIFTDASRLLVFLSLRHIMLSYVCSLCFLFCFICLIVCLFIIIVVVVVIFFFVKVTLAVSISLPFFNVFSFLSQFYLSFPPLPLVL